MKSVRGDFPMLSTTMNGRPLVYLDNAATAQKPEAVLRAMDRFYREDYANVHRGVYELSQDSTLQCEAVREKVRRFVGAERPEEIVFVRGATEAINLVAASYGRRHLKAGDEILITEIEHHANIVPWQRLAEEKRLTLKVAPVNDRGELDLDRFTALLGARTYLAAFTQVSNALGSVLPAKEMIARAHHAGAVVLVDGAQSVPHMRTDVRELGADFFVFSGHKLYGPTGIGVLYGRYALLEKMDPYQSGGDMIEQVSFERTTYAKPPARFEAGTPAIAEIIGLGAAIDYVEALGYDAIARREHELLRYATAKLTAIPGLRLIGTAADKAAVLSFVMDGIHPHDIGTVLDREGICVRAGHHCAQPTMKRFGVPATTRASLAFYNTEAEVDALVAGLHKVREIFR